MTVQADGTRLDRAVANWRGLSRAAVLRLLDQGAVSCNGHVMNRANKGDALSGGDCIELSGAYARGEVPRRDGSMDLVVLSEGDGWLVIDKPAGTPVRPHTLDEAGTILNAVVARCPYIIGVGEGGLRSGVVHRLDTDTSGALLVATDQDVWDRLRFAFAEHRIQKRYLAIVAGAIDAAGVCRRHLRVAAHQPARVQVESEVVEAGDARLCSLGWRVIERFGERASLIEVDLHTGFLHQVRAMMSALGHAVIGDSTYGNSATREQATRQMLHAKSLSFEAIKVETAMPNDMQQVLQSLRG